MRKNTEIKKKKKRRLLRALPHAGSGSRLGYRAVFPRLVSGCDDLRGATGGRQRFNVSARLPAAAGRRPPAPALLPLLLLFFRLFLFSEPSRRRSGVTEAGAAQRS